MGIYKCGFDDGLPAEEDWKNNISCQMVGCKNCKHFNGTVYFEANIKKGIAMWADTRKHSNNPGGWIYPVLCCYVDGRPEYEKEAVDGEM